MDMTIDIHIISGNTDVSKHLEKGNILLSVGNDWNGGYVNLSQIWADFLPRAGNINAQKSMSYEFVYCLIFGQINLT